ncbi:MAG: hypothetical protein U0517_04080 [Candidatus Andersenbacteria bacterium]
MQQDADRCIKEPFLFTMHYSTRPQNRFSRALVVTGIVLVPLGDVTVRIKIEDPVVLIVRELFGITNRDNDEGRRHTLEHRKLLQLHHDWSVLGQRRLRFFGSATRCTEHQ